MSPLVAKTAIWFLERWCASYLMPSAQRQETISPALRQHYGQGCPEAVKILVNMRLLHGGGAHIRCTGVVQEFTLHTAQVILLHWPEELQLLEATCELLHSLADNSCLQPFFSRSSSWAAIMHAYASTQPSSVLSKLSGVILTKLASYLNRFNENFRNGYSSFSLGTGDVPDDRPV